MNTLPYHTAIGHTAVTPSSSVLQTGNTSELLRDTLRSLDADLQSRFATGAPVEQLLHERTTGVDEIVYRIFQLYLSPAADDLALSAVGGYGRCELHPYSDIDILILIRGADTKKYRRSIEQFIALLWDVGLPVSHSVRTPLQCADLAGTDLSIATNLMEARFLTGAADLFAQLQRHMASERLWPPRDFLLAKQQEQLRRHAKYHGTAYRLEPNIKEGPGGLRDIQMIGWVAQRQLHSSGVHSLVACGFLDADEYQALQNGQHFLWRVRFALHMLYGRREDRLLFDAQTRLAQQFGYLDTPANLAVEQFMQAYYRTVKQLNLLNEMLLQSLEEAILCNDLTPAIPLSECFEECGGFLRLRDPRVFQRRPKALLEIFRVLQQHSRLKGVGAETLRRLCASLDLIDDAFRASSEHRSLFMQILRAPRGVTHELRRMNRYGVLGRYLPALGKVVGRMQYDLFHTYTVDEHILFVVSNLRRFALTRYDHEFPLCSEIMQTLAKPELAYLAALFHDIAKGRGGDHSRLGAAEAEKFCLEHGLSRYDARLVSWLVRHHLLLSLTAQKKDIGDPRVVRDFAHHVGDQLHLDYLYVLTVADVRGTNPELWNSWKASLFRQLYLEASRALRQGLENPIDKDELIRETQSQAMSLLHARGFASEAVHKEWTAFSETYFLSHTADEIAWHTAGLRIHGMDDAPLVMLHPGDTRGGTAISICSGQDALIFARVTATLAELGLTVLDARLVPMTGGRRLDTYVVLEDNREPIVEAARLAEIADVVQHEAQRRNLPPHAVMRRAPRQVRLFTTTSEVEFAPNPFNGRTVLEIHTSDRPGLLSLIGEALADCNIRLWNAKITTVGERAEDVFFITDTDNQPFADAAMRMRLRTALLTRLGEVN
ncbi:MAG: [protein-PII] uridylyltransferase [Gammaproteobacteria bacterium]|nr:[protein-PII] uridylyltransferase [Gammaproteobacteria bacterium]